MTKASSARSAKNRKKRLRKLELNSLKALARARWPRKDDLKCLDPSCSSKNVKKLKIRSGPRWPRVRYQCYDCKRQFEPTTRTIFKRHRLRLYKWLWILARLNDPQFDHRAYRPTIADIARELNVSYKTTWKITARLKQADPDFKARLISCLGTVERTFFSFSAGWILRS